MHKPDDLLDLLRIVLFLISGYSVITLYLRFRDGGADWNVKTKDHWFGLLMWSLSGCVFAAQGIALDRPLTPATIFMMAAILATGKAVHRKGNWGNDAK